MAGYSVGNQKRTRGYVLNAVALNLNAGEQFKKIARIYLQYSMCYWVIMFYNATLLCRNTVPLTLAL